jgi:hypothetical protein
MKSTLLTLMMVLISSAAFASEIDGKWAGVYQGVGTLTFEFRTEGKKLYGFDLSSGDSKTEIQKGKIKNNEISFEVPVTMGDSKLSVVYKGKILNDNEIELSFKTRARGSRGVGFGGFNDGFSGGMGGSGGGTAGFGDGFGGGGGFGGVSGESAKFVIKRLEK